MGRKGQSEGEGREMEKRAREGIDRNGKFLILSPVTCYLLGLLRVRGLGHQSLALGPSPC